MKLVLSAIVGLCLMSALFITYAQASTKEVTTANELSLIEAKNATCQITNLVSDLSLKLAIKTENQICLPTNADQYDQFARRGCCSHHGGVCGCSSGRALCCDGQLSPSCGC